MKKGRLYDAKTGLPIDHPDDDIVRDGQGVRVSLMLAGGQPPPEREFIVDTIGRPVALRTHAEKMTRAAALEARDADYRKTMTRNYARDASDPDRGDSPSTPR